MERRRQRIFATMSETFWVVVLALIGLFAFFVALGAFAPGDVLWLTIAIALLAMAWIGHAIWLNRHAHGRDVRAVRARERRGF